eukprot:775901-Amphidinium_carterae.1
MPQGQEVPTLVSTRKLLLASCLKSHLYPNVPGTTSYHALKPCVNSPDKRNMELLLAEMTMCTV